MDILDLLNDIVWSPVLVVLLVGTGLYFTVRTRCVQARRIGLMARLLFAKTKFTKSSFSPFQAFCVALSGRVGTGNIVGVATAIAFGGPGAVFWMWVTAFLGASTAFTESTLAQLYNFKHNGILRGGPACYIEKGLKLPWLGIVFAVLTIFGYGILPVTVQSNGVSQAFLNSFDVPTWITGLVVVFFLALVIIGGVRRIAHVATAITPFMAVGYMLVAFVVVAVNIKAVPHVFAMIFSSALGINPLVGGILGTTIAMGVKRGLFSNEAGQGGGAIVSASAENIMPANQGLVQAFSVYVDTLLVCTCTALMILTTGNYNVFDASTGEVLCQNVPELSNNYVGYTQASIDTVLPGFGSSFVAVALSFFVFTSLMAYYFYAESSIIYMFHRSDPSADDNVLPSGKETVTIWIYRFVILGMVMVGACASSDTAWKLGDIGIGAMTWVNVAALLILFPKALSALKDCEQYYSKKKKQ